MNPTFKNPLVIGCGSWGTGLAQLLAQKTKKVTMLGRGEIVDRINESHINSRYLPGVLLSDRICATLDPKAVEDADVILFVVPTSAIRETSKELLKFSVPSSTPLISCAKGIERESGKRMSEVISDSFPDNPVAVLSGPNHAEEIARQLPAAATIGCADQAVGEALQDLFSNERFRAYTNNDIAGVELGGALKNVFAIAAGVATGLKLGDNAIAALVTRSLAEMTRLGVALGGNVATFSGLSGLGDLVTTCFSTHSRNHRVGLALADGKTLAQAVDDLGMVAEGVKNTQSIYEAARKAGARTPIIDVVYAMLYEDVPPAEGLNRLFGQAPRVEHE
ncbi:NAD(P)-dependent glycerol-3-phosphate dehydrogenase [Akkermansiaceae bacterium]|nr:NAD(P)-dependent glycerol-3-phosphate dehydrogenase [Akkermansiaceae bacterium]MDB4106693.1 NAD(P)-dependent glycerol-3-phosphate dehydrogenase [bacterium]MDB0056457.1 NAD(P)-dependent glycerol-3-phosphate dehydrogenase [Akkermansiaceae bacterium]MDB4142745.1 NAD(P)-dependent glycerol-3-phosphate dehydrogenase [Akkermansiaceae bacterium]MDB4262265.1 NAD(P)-dependent glycerol-3-phosphate dehydrogenase [Akkermansiaceae bacterium]